MSMCLIGMHIVGVDLMSVSHRRGSHRHASYERASPTGELWVISLNNLCAKLPRTRIRLNPELALEIAPLIHSDLHASVGFRYRCLRDRLATIFVKTPL
jgi:hypothetical protein